MKIYPLSAQNYVKYIPLLRKIGICYHILPAALILLYFAKLIDFAFCALFSILFLFIAWVVLGLGLRYGKIATSNVEFHDNFLIVKDKKGKVWRYIQYTSILRIQVTKLTGFMSGYHGANGIAPYIVIFMSDSNLPMHGSLYKYYASNQYFPIFYSNEIFSTIVAQIPNIEITYDSRQD